jgi:RNA polymerase sigma-70 factor (ECF subfamily)
MSGRGSISAWDDMGRPVVRSQCSLDSNDHGATAELVAARRSSGSQPLGQAMSTLSADRAERLRRALHEHFALVWRTVRRFGIDEGSADDAAQQVFLIFLDRLAEVLPGAERAFLVASCVRVAANLRRLRERRAEVVHDDDLIDSRAQSPEQLLQWKQLREQLDRALLALTAEQRHVFVLHELEGFSLPEVAASLSIPVGTATSRLRRARLAFEVAVSAMSLEGVDP